MAFTLSHRGTLYLPIELYPDEQLFSVPNRCSLVPQRNSDCYDPIADLKRTCIDAWNTSGMIISIIQMNVRIELDDHKRHPRCRVVSRGISSSHRNSIKDIYCARPSDAFFRFLSCSPMNTAMRVFARLAGSLISRASLLDGNDGKSAMDIEGRGFYSYRERACLPSARERV